MATPCVVTDMKYSSGLPTCAPSGLRTHICQTPRMQAARNAANESQKWARQRRSALRTGNPPLGVRLHLAFQDHLDGRPHLTMAEPAILVARHQKIPRPCEFGVHLR